jgi:sortase (surface protein transpeptidase)
MLRRKRPQNVRSNVYGIGAACSWLILMLALSGSLMLGHGVAAQQSAPVPESRGEFPISAVPLSEAPVQYTQYLPFSQPTSISIPSIGVTSELISVGKQPDGTMEVPQHPNFDKAAWYRESPSPGQYGSSVIIGHVDSYVSNGASVFFNLAKLKPGDTINVRRADGQTAIFSVRALRDYGKQALPTEIIYAPVGDSAELRLITCSGRFDQITQSYENNTVVYATLSFADL